MRRAKARLALLNIKQNRMAADLGMSVTRLNRVLNGWLLATVEEEQRIRDYLAASSAMTGSNRSRP